MHKPSRIVVKAAPKEERIVRFRDLLPGEVFRWYNPLAHQGQGDLAMKTTDHHGSLYVYLEYGEVFDAMAFNKLDCGVERVYGVFMEGEG